MTKVGFEARPYRLHVPSIRPPYLLYHASDTDAKRSNKRFFNAPHLRLKRNQNHQTNSVSRNVRRPIETGFSLGQNMHFCATTKDEK